jgi:hypothetical protein
MPINFPNSPNNNEVHTDGTIQWRFSTANNSWTMITTGNTGLENATDYDNTIVGLNRVSTQNLQVPAIGLSFHLENKTLKVNALTTQLQNMLEFRTSTDTLINAFNQRGALLNAGRIYYQSSQPTPNAADTGLLWHDTVSGVLYIWDGNNWVVSGGGVTTVGNQDITGAKTFTNNIFLSSGAKLNGQGASKSIVIAPTNAGSTPVDCLTVATTAATFTVPVELSAIGTTAKTVLATIADTQTITGAKTFANGLKITGTGSIRTTDDTTANAASDNIIIQPNMSASGRSIKLFNNADTADSNGITIRPKNAANQGSLNINGSTNITGDLFVTGAVNTTIGLSAASVSIGSLKSQNGTAAQNIDFLPTPIGNLTFNLVTDGTWTSHGINVTNTSTTKNTAFYWRREQILSGSYTYVIRKVVLPPLGSGTCLASSGSIVNGSPAPTSNEVVSGLSTVVTLLNTTNAPCTMTFTLAQA